MKTLRSMTGFGQSERTGEALDISVEIKTLNSRYLDLKLHLPRELLFLEPEVRRLARAFLRRGRADVYVNLMVRCTDQYRLNRALAENYLQLGRTATALGVKGELDVATLLQLPGALVPRDVSRSREVREAILETVREALTGVVQARLAEGEAIQTDLRARLENLTRVVAEIDRRKDEIQALYREKLRAQIEALESGLAIDETRLAQEILYHARNADVSEEITRLGSHMAQFAVVLEGGDAEAVGRRLDFICQEMGREMNTILSKSPLAAASELALEGKSEIEKIREQVQNVE